MPASENLKRIVIDPVTRVEGHGKVTILLDEKNNVKSTRLHIVEFRGFERFIQGRLYWEVPVIVERLCGICPVSHHLTAAKAMDKIAGVRQLTPVGVKMRRLMHYAQTLQSHATHFFHLASPDLLFGFDAEPEQRNVFSVIGAQPEFVRHGILLRKFGQEIIKATAGKRIHGTGAIPGGINKNLTIPERDLFIESFPDILAWAQEALFFIKDYTLKHFSQLQTMGTYESNYMCLVREDGAMDLYDGKLRMIDANGATIFDQVDCSDYLDYFSEEVKDWSYMKFPFVKSLGPRNGWYRVGPLARINACSYIDTPLAEAARKDFFESTGSHPNHATMCYHWARMIELVHAAEKIGRLLHDSDLQSYNLCAPRGNRCEEAVAVLEAPRGTLFHHYRVGRDDLVTMANLIVSTTHNNEPMNRAVYHMVKNSFEGKAQITESMLSGVETVIRAFDPCLSCATHAIGMMPLIVELFNGNNELIQRRVRF